MTSSKRIFATFDEVAIGGDLVLSDGDLTLKTANNVDAHRMARSTFSVKEQSYVEFVIFSPSGAARPLSPVGGVPPVAVGFTSVGDGVAAKYIGEGADGIGYCPGDGNVYNAGTAIQFVGTATYGDTITLVIDPANIFDATMTVLKNGAQLGDPVSITQFLSWYFAATVSGAPGDYAVNVNAGKTPQRHPLPRLTGFSQARTTISPVYVATEPYISKSTDTLPNNKFSGDVDATAAVTISRGMRPWMFGRSAPPELGGQTQVEIRLNDPNGIYRTLKSSDLRDLPISISRVAQDASQNSAEAVFTALIDNIGRPNDFQLTLYGRDKLVLLQSQLVRPLFPPSVDSAFRGKPRPLALGVCRTFTPPLYDSAGLNFALSCGPITAVGLFRVQGKVDVFGVDETLNADSASIHRATAPAGKFTAETSSIGAAFSATAPDALSGSGDFTSVGTLGGGVTAGGSAAVTIGTGTKTFNVGPGLSFVATSQVKWTGNVGTMTGTVTSYSGALLTVNVTSTTGSGTSTGSWNITGGVNQPTGWTAGGGYPTDLPGTMFQVQGAAPNELVVQGNVASGIYWFQHQTFTVPAGASFAYSIDVAEIPYLGPTHDSAGNPGTATPAIMCIGGVSGTNIAFMNWARFALTKAGTYTGTFTNNSANAMPLTIGFLANEIVQGSNAGAYYYLKLRSIKLNSIASLTSNVTLQGLTLDQMLRALLIQYGPLTDADYDPSGAQAIDAATGYQYGLYVGPDETPQVMDCVRRVLNSAGADLIVLRSGKVTAVRLIAPESVDPLTIAGSLTPTDIKGTLVAYEDMAENLTTRFDGCPNISPYADSDFANVSTTAVPLAVREQLKRAFQWTVTAGVQVSPSYAAAYNAPPLPSQFDRQADGQAEDTRIGNLYTSLRNFYVGTYFSPLGRQFEIGQVWNVTYPLPGLETGRQLLIVGINETPSDETTQLVFWGL